MASQTDIFDIPMIWKTDPMKAFGAFIQSTEFVLMGKHGKARHEKGLPVYPLSARSAATYLHMAAHFFQWLRQRRLLLHEVAAADILQFLDAKDEEHHARRSSLIRVRYIRLLERIYSHLGVLPNPATRAAYAVHEMRTTGRDQPKVILSEKEQIALLGHLQPVASFDPNHPTAPSWKQRRNRALIALMLGAGLRVSEAMSLQVSHIGQKDASGAIPVTVVNASVRTAMNTHRTVIRPFAVPYVLPWIQERKLHKIPGKLLFPASLQSGAMLNKATVYRQVKAALERAGLTALHKGGRTLRNSFAARELVHDTPVELVGEFLGHRERRSTEKYRPPEMGPLGYPHPSSILEKPE